MGIWLYSVQSEGVLCRLVNTTETWIQHNAPETKKSQVAEIFSADTAFYTGSFAYIVLDEMKRLLRNINIMNKYTKHLWNLAHCGVGKVNEAS